MYLEKIAGGGTGGKYYFEGMRIWLFRDDPLGETATDVGTILTPPVHEGAGSDQQDSAEEFSLRG